MEGSFKTAPAADDAAAISFVWVADLAGQGWGRNPEFDLTTIGGKTVSGGYIVFDTMEDLAPEFALFQGDIIYADNSIPPVKEIPTGGNWTNNQYNHGDEKMPSFLAKTPIFVQWDDHEVTNNWYPHEILGDPLYEEGTPANTLYENSLQAMYEFNPIEEGSSIFRSQKFGKHVEIFFPDYRSFRGPIRERGARSKRNDGRGAVAVAYGWAFYFHCHLEAGRSSVPMTQLASSLAVKAIVIPSETSCPRFWAVNTSSRTFSLLSTMKTLPASSH